jgi:hypothetical protein
MTGAAQGIREPVNMPKELLHQGRLIPSTWTLLAGSNPALGLPTFLGSNQ